MESNEHIDGPVVRNKSDWTPSRGRNLLLDSCIHSLNKASKNLESFVNKPVKDNLPRNEMNALRELKSDHSIIIKEADKGGAVCIMDTDFYRIKISEMLNDIFTYKIVSKCNDTQTMNKIKSLISNYECCLKDEEVDYLLNFEYRESNFYGLPKVHKSQTINNAIENTCSDYICTQSPQDLTFRPIVAGPVCATSRLSHLMDCILTELPKHTKSFVRDDIDFLSKLQRHLPNNDEYALVTLDITSLYTNIDTDLGIRAMRYWIQNLKNFIPARFSEDFIIDRIQLILENNTFHFNGEHYLQLQGTAMGTKMAPSYVNLVLAYLEELLYEKLKSTNEEYGSYIEHNFMRYLDDCFIIWPTSKWNIDDFVHELNAMHSNINFTWCIQKTEIAFLDIMVTLQNNQVSTDIFYKPTDTHQYLHFRSCHPRHIKINLPYCMARRVCTIVDDETTKQQRLDELVNFFRNQKYPLQLIMAGIKKAKSIPVEILRTPKEKKSEKILPFVFTHNPRNPNMVSLVHSTLDVLQSDNRMNETLKSNKVIISRRQPSNLKSLLTRAKFCSDIDTNGGSSKCQDKRCGTCPFLRETDHIEIKSTGESFKIKTSMNCKSKNLLYIITCHGCGEQYVGKTNDNLNNRVRVHKQHIRSPIYRKLGMSKHIADCSTLDIKFDIVPFLKLTDNKTYGGIKEDRFITRFKPSLNGLHLD